MVDLTPTPLSGIRCHAIAETDIDAIVDLLTTGFGEEPRDAWSRARRFWRFHRRNGSGGFSAVVRLHLNGPGRRSRQFWIEAFRRLAEHPTPPGFPKYGYCLESGGKPVGVLLTIYSTVVANGVPTIRCNVSSWYVAPPYRSYGAALVSAALRRKHITYINVTPSPLTWGILEAQGYRRYCEGVFISIPVLRAPTTECEVAPASPPLHPGDDLSPFETELLLAHARHGCLSVIGKTAEGRHPFVFALRSRFGMVPFAYLVYCRSLDSFVRFAPQLGRFLARRGFLLVAFDADGPVRGLVGTYAGNLPKYFKGADRPRLGDLAYSERAVLNV